MYYNCVRCGKKKELRKSKKPSNARRKYLDLEKQVKESKVVELRTTSGTRKICPWCLKDLIAWLKPVDSD